jgi:hypothetical protein
MTIGALALAELVDAAVTALVVPLAALGVMTMGPLAAATPLAVRVGAVLLLITVPLGARVAASRSTAAFDAIAGVGFAADEAAGVSVPLPLLRITGAAAEEVVTPLAAGVPTPAANWPGVAVVAAVAGVAAGDVLVLLTCAAASALVMLVAGATAELTVPAVGALLTFPAADVAALGTTNAPPVPTAVSPAPLLMTGVGGELIDELTVICGLVR